MKATLSVLVCLAMVSCVAALPLGAERFVADVGAEPVGKDSTLFLVRVNNRPTEGELSAPETTTANPETARQYPWPYPPVFESALPEEAKQRLVEIFNTRTLDADERANQINAVFDSLPQAVIERLPLPVEYERLPVDVYRRLNFIHTAPGFAWAERQRLTQNIIESLPSEVRQLMKTARFGGPPPGFEYVLAPSIYKQLLFIHYNPELSREQRAEMITQVMRQVPAQQIEQLPLPAGMDRLPAELQRRLRSLVYDYTVPQQTRVKRVHDFVQMLPVEMRPPLRR